MIRGRRKSKCFAHDGYAEWLNDLEASGASLIELDDAFARVAALDQYDETARSSPCLHTREPSAAVVSNRKLVSMTYLSRRGTSLVIYAAPIRTESGLTRSGKRAMRNSVRCTKHADKWTWCRKNHIAHFLSYIFP
jgi:hypothetical protein